MGVDGSAEQAARMPVAELDRPFVLYNLAFKLQEQVQKTKIKNDVISRANQTLGETRHGSSRQRF